MAEVIDDHFPRCRWLLLTLRPGGEAEADIGTSPCITQPGWQWPHKGYLMFLQNYTTQYTVSSKKYWDSDTLFVVLALYSSTLDNTMTMRLKWRLSALI